MKWAFWANLPADEGDEVPKGTARELSKRPQLMSPCPDCCDCLIWNETFDRAELGPEWTHEGDWSILRNAPLYPWDGLLYTTASDSKCTWAKQVKESIKRYVITLRVSNHWPKWSPNPSHPATGFYRLFVNGGKQFAELEWRFQTDRPSWYFRLHDGDTCVGEQGYVLPADSSEVEPQMRVMIDRERDIITFTVTGIGGPAAENTTQYDLWPTLSYKTELDSNEIAIGTGPDTSFMAVGNFRVARASEDVEGCDKSNFECRYLDSFAAGALSEDVWETSGTWETVLHTDWQYGAYWLKNSGPATATCKMEPPGGGVDFRLETELWLQMDPRVLDASITLDGGNAELKISSEYYLWEEGLPGVPSNGFILFKLRYADGETLAWAYRYGSGSGDLDIRQVWLRMVIAIQFNESRISCAFGGPDFWWTVVPWYTPWGVPGPFNPYPSPQSSISNYDVCEALIRPHAVASPEVGFDVRGGNIRIEHFRLCRVQDELRQPDFTCSPVIQGMQGVDSYCEGRSLRLHVPGGSGLWVPSEPILDWGSGMWYGSDWSQNANPRWGANVQIQLRHSENGSTYYASEWRAILVWSERGNCTYATDWYPMGGPVSSVTFNLVYAGTVVNPPGSIPGEWFGV